MGSLPQLLEQDQLLSLLTFHYIIVYLFLHFQITYYQLVKLRKNWIALSSCSPLFAYLDIRTQAIIRRGTKRKGLYYVDDVASGHVHQVQSRNVHDYKNIWLWHHQLGHASFGYLKKLFSSLFNDISDPSSSLKCNVCILAKSHRTSYPLSLNKSTKPFELIHSDVWGPAPITTQSGIRWFITFVDDCTRMT